MSFNRTDPYERVYAYGSYTWEGLSPRSRPSLIQHRSRHQFHQYRNPYQHFRVWLQERFGVTPHQLLRRSPFPEEDAEQIVTFLIDTAVLADALLRS